MPYLLWWRVVAPQQRSEPKNIRNSFQSPVPSSSIHRLRIELSYDLPPSNRPRQPACLKAILPPPSVSHWVRRKLSKKIKAYRACGGLHGARELTDGIIMKAVMMRQRRGSWAGSNPSDSRGLPVADARGHPIQSRRWGGFWLQTGRDRRSQLQRGVIRGRAAQGGARGAWRRVSKRLMNTTARALEKGR
jgi:hypothetical protein